MGRRGNGEGRRVVDFGQGCTRRLPARRPPCDRKELVARPLVLVENSAAPHQPLVCETWKEEKIKAEGTLMRTARGCATLLLAPTLDAPPGATQLPRSKPPTRWVSTRSLRQWKRSS